MEVPPKENITYLAGKTGASYTQVLAPIELNVFPEKLAAMPEERRGIVSLISTTVKDNLERLDDFRYRLPQSEFTADSTSDQVIGSLLSTAELCQLKLNSSELETITMDPDTGDRRRLTAKQCREIFETGRLSFPSRAFPHTDHVWKLAPWMIIGRKKIQNKFQTRIGGALNHLLVYCPSRIARKREEWDGGFFTSVIEGVFRIGRSIRGVIAALVGLPETAPRHRNYVDRAHAKIQYVREQCTDSEGVNCSRYFDVSWKSMKPLRGASSAYDESNLIAVLEMFKDPSKDDDILDERKLSLLRSARSEQEEKEIHSIMLDESIDDDEKRRILVECARALTILGDGENKLYLLAGSEKRRMVAHGMQTHPILCLSELWFSRWLRKRGAKHILQWHREKEDENVATMRSQGLHYAAKLEESSIKFDRVIWPQMRKSWLRDRVAVNEYKHIYVLFDPYRWLHGEEVSTRTVLTSTAGFGWRFTLLWRDMRSSLRNGIYFTIVTNLWRGPLGLRALFSSKDVAFAWNVADGATQVRKFHYSLQTRLHAIWQRVRELRLEFEDDTGILGKRAMRWLHFIVNYGFRGCVSTALVVLLQPPLTLLNVIVTPFIAVTAILWAPLSAVVAWCFSWLIYDWRSFQTYRLQYVHLGNSTKVCTNERYLLSQEWFPVPIHLLKALYGVIEIAINGFGILFNPLFAVLWLIFACSQRGVRIVWEGMWLPFLRQFGRWPVRDSFLAKRVQGVGRSETYYYRLSTEVVARCVRARLEQLELKKARATIETAAKRPVEKLKSFLNDVLAGLCAGTAGPGTALNELLQAENQIVGSVRANSGDARSCWRE